MTAGVLIVFFFYHDSFHHLISIPLSYGGLVLSCSYQPADGHYMQQSAPSLAPAASVVPRVPGLAHPVSLGGCVSLHSFVSGAHSIKIIKNVHK